MTCLPYNHFGYAWAMVPYVGWSVKARRLCTVYTSLNVSFPWNDSLFPVFQAYLFAQIFSCKACRTVVLQWKEALSAIEHSRSFLELTTKDKSHTLSVNRQVKASLHRERHYRTPLYRKYAAYFSSQGQMLRTTWYTQFCSLQESSTKGCGCGYWGQSRCLGVDVRLCNSRLCRL